MRIDDVPTPAYVYDLDQVRRNHARLASALPRPATLYYSLKANPHPLIAACLRAAGCRAEVCSPGELDAAYAAGFEPDEILYTGPGKRDVDVTDALKSGVGTFSVDSPEAIAQLDRLGTADFLLRVNGDRPAPGQRLAMTGVASQFGADRSWIEAEPARFRGTDRARLRGFHLYTGTNSALEDDLFAQFIVSMAVAAQLRDRLGVEIEVLDLGGGFGAPYARHGDLPDFPTLAARLAEALDATWPGWRYGAPRVAFESGRYLTATAGRLRTRVLDVKRSHDRRVVVLESGINHLGGMSGLRRVPLIAPHLHGGDPQAPTVETMIAGPLCTPLDTWHARADLAAVRAGDVLEVPNVGAYGLTASLVAFLGHPAPAEVVVEGGRVREVTEMRLHRQRTYVNGED
jgi:diaminopimelate decarboxylase